MGFLGNFVILLASFLALYLVLALIKFLHKVWWIPIRMQYKMKLQGITGPPYKFLHGNTKEISNMRRDSMGKPVDDLSHHIFPRILPHVHSWMNKYGNILECQIQLVLFPHYNKKKKKKNHAEK